MVGPSLSGLYLNNNTIDIIGAFYYGYVTMRLDKQTGNNLFTNFYSPEDIKYHGKPDAP